MPILPNKSPRKDVEKTQDVVKVKKPVPEIEVEVAPEHENTQATATSLIEKLAEVPVSLTARDLARVLGERIMNRSTLADSRECRKYRISLLMRLITPDSCNMLKVQTYSIRTPQT